MMLDAALTAPRHSHVWPTRRLRSWWVPSSHCYSEIRNTHLLVDRLSLPQVSYAYFEFLATGFALRNGRLALEQLCQSPFSNQR
jgi:hypothetical protein